MASPGVTVTEVTTLVAQLGGLAILGGTLAGILAVVFRWYADEAAPRGLALLVGLAGVALYLNTTSALAEVITRRGGPTETQVALFNIAAFAVGAAGSELGRRVGDRFETDVFLRPTGDSRTADGVGRLGRALGRVVEVRLPDDIEDVVGYDPVEERTKEELAGRSFVFPRDIDRETLEARLVARLQADYGVGTVDLELAPDGTVDYLAVGRRAAGIGPTLPPATNAVAVRADPPFAASAGDLVQLWETGPARRVLTAELRGVAGDTVTLAIDAADTPKVDPQDEYRLVTLPVEDRPDREFASLLRAAGETFTSVTVAEGSPLARNPVGAVAVSIVALATERGATVALPTRETVLEPGTVAFAIGTPDRLRRLEVAAAAVPEGIESTVTPSSPVGAGVTPPHAGGEPTERPAAAGENDEGLPGQADADAFARLSNEADEGAGWADDTEPERTGEPESRDADDEGSARRRAGDTADAGQPTEEGAPTEERAGVDEPTGEVDIASASTPPSFDELQASMTEEERDERRASDAREDAESTADVDDLDFGDEDFDIGDEDLEDLPLGDDGGERGSGDRDESDGHDDDEGDGHDEDETGEGEETQTDEEDDDVDEDDEDDADDAEDADESDGDDDIEDDDDGEDGDAGSTEDDDDEEDGDAGSTEDDDDGEDGDAGSTEDDDGRGDGGGGGGGGGDGGGDGGGTFSQLKEEFESGDAEWADDIDDSPGGDMRLDE